MSFLVVSKIFRQFVNLLTPDDKYSLAVKRENLTQQIQMQCSKKLNVFSEFFTALQKSTFNFQPFQKKVEPHSICISDVKDGKKRAHVNV